jgi:outer membrane protein assembly factor BamB
LWRAPLSEKALAGVAATCDYVLVADRELADTTDVFRCLSAESGKELWSHRYFTEGKLDYGNSSRATPLVHGPHVFFYGAFGHLSCALLGTGDLVWQKEMKFDFDATEELPWGFCGSPLIAEGKLILAPGGKETSLVALEPATGKLLWKSSGDPPSYGSLIVATLGGKKQIVGHDATTLSGWDLATGKRLWTHRPPQKRDFNVPTPLVHAGRLFVVTENNGSRLFRFDDKGILVDKPIATFDELNPDTHTPVVIGERLFGAGGDLYCLDLANKLKLLWKGKDPAFRRHTSLIASSSRLLVATGEGELLLIDALADKFTLLGRQKVFADEAGLLSHPALVGDRLYLRGSNEIVCVSLAE